MFVLGSKSSISATEVRPFIVNSQSSPETKQTVHNLTSTNQINLS